jgi:hypothetical protein
MPNSTQLLTFLKAILVECFLLSLVHYRMVVLMIMLAANAYFDE